MKDATSLPLEAVGYSEQFVRCLHSLGVCFVRSLCDDQVDHLVDHLDVGHFEDALMHLSEPFIARVADDGRAAGRCFEEEVLSDGAKSSRIDKPGELYLADLLRLRLSVYFDRNQPFRADHDLGSVLGNKDRGLDEQSVRVDDLSFPVEIPAACAGIGHFAVRLKYLKETVPLYGDVERTVRHLEVPLRHDAGRSDDPDAESNLDAGRHHRRGFDGCAGLPVDLVEQIREVGPLLLEAGSIHVREVVRNGREIGLRPLEPGQ